MSSCSAKVANIDSWSVLSDHCFFFITQPFSPLWKFEEKTCQSLPLGFDHFWQEGETLHLSIYSGCKLVENRINYAVMSQSSGHVISWGQEYLVAKTTGSIVPDGNSTDEQPKWAAELNLR